MQTHPAVGKLVGKEGFGRMQRCYFICELAMPGNTWLENREEKNIKGCNGFEESLCCLESCS